MLNIAADDGVKLSYRIIGNGPRTVIFLHPWVTSSVVWNHFFESFDTTGLRCVVVDCRGHGGSDRPASGYGLDRLARDLLNVADGLKAEKFVVVGHSVGGMIALKLATEVPQRFEGLLAIDPAPADGIKVAPEIRGFFEASAGNVELGKQIVAQQSKSMAPEDLELLASEWGKTAPQAIKGVLDAWMNANYLEQLSRVSCPVLWLGARERFGPPDVQKQMIEAGPRAVAKMPRARMAYLENVIHYHPVERPKDTGAIVQAFLAGLG